MKRSETYATKQKEAILNIIKSKEKTFTVKDIYTELKEKVGLTTVYRVVNKLEKEGKIKITIGKDGKTNYQFLKHCDKENHFYLKCDKCGDIIHVDCDCIQTLYSHVLKKHKFKLSRANIIISGLCDKCKGGEK